LKKHYFGAYAGLPRAVYFLFAARLVNSMGYFVGPLLTLILTQKLGMGKAEAGTTLALLTLTQAPCVLLGGRLADTFGRKRTLILGSAAGALLYLVCGLALSGRAMVYCIILAADFVALAIPASEALLADLTRPEQRQAAYSLLYLGINIGAAVSPLVGGLLFQNHLSLLFVLDAATTFAAVLIIALNVEEARPCAAQTEQPREKLSLFAALSRAPMIAAFVFLLFLYDFCYSQWGFMLPAQFGDRFSGDGARMFSVLASINAVTVIVTTPLITRLTQSSGRCARSRWRARSIWPPTSASARAGATRFTGSSRCSSRWARSARPSRWARLSPTARRRAVSAASTPSPR
jgi:MFS family permease